MKKLFKLKLAFVIVLFVCEMSISALNASALPNHLSEGAGFDIKISVYIYNPAIKNYELTHASIKITGDKPYSITDSLFAETNTITLKDGSSKYQLEIKKTDYEPYKEEFSIKNIKLFSVKPLIVILNKKTSKTKSEKPKDKTIKKDTISKSNPQLKLIENELVAYYPFDGYPNDSCINHRNGQDYGPSGYTAGKLLEARFFSNNQNDDATVTDFTILPNMIDSSEFTISFWASFDYSETHQSILYLSPGQDWTRANFFLCLSKDLKLSVIINGLDLRTIDYSHQQLLDGQFSNAYRNSKNLELNRYYFISCTFKKSVFAIYIDGKLYARYDNVYRNIGKPDAMLLLGACPKPGMLYYPYTGQIDELKFFKKALSETEINLLQRDL